MSDNIRVAIRIRPLTKSEIDGKERILWNVKDSQSIIPISSAFEDKFRYDRVFDKDEENEDVYTDLCLPIVRSVMQGFNGTLFAYGQTASGKTYTMMGEHKGITKGLIHYAIDDIFNSIQEMPDREFLLRVSFLEIYNERVYDLLSEKNEDLKLLEDCYGYIKVNGLQEKIVQTSDHILNCMSKGLRKRRTAETKMNERSSRSHCIFRMIIESRRRDEEDKAVNVSQLNLVDLAGSENVNLTNDVNRQKEGIKINLSLSTLSQVISQLSEKADQFINFRNSKLTRLLQNSLGGNALTAIICTIKPTSSKKTLSTLNFALRAKKIKNKPEKNEILTDQALLKQYANKIKKLAHELEASKKQGKELAEKTKQNEDLKKQIEALKANFVSQIDITEMRQKAVRRETWHGAKLSAISFPLPKSSRPRFSDLPILEEEPEGDTDPLEYNGNATQVRKSSVFSSTQFPFATSPINVAHVETQTDCDNNSIFEDNSNGNIGEAMSMVTDLKDNLIFLQNEFAELNEYTTLEKQVLKAENELYQELEALKKENCFLRKALESSSLLPENPISESSESNILEEEKADKDEMHANAICESNAAESIDPCINNELNDNSDADKSTLSVNNKQVCEKSRLDCNTAESIDPCTNNKLSDNSGTDKSTLSISNKQVCEKSRLDRTESTIMDESMKSNFLALYDELESEEVSKLKEEIETLKYDIEMKDKHLNLLKDKMEIKEQMISSLKDEISLSKTVNTCDTMDIPETNAQTCQTDPEFILEKIVSLKECQTSPSLNQYTSVKCKKCDLSEKQRDSPSKFDLIAISGTRTSPLKAFLSSTQTLSEELFPTDVFLEGRNVEVIDHSTQITPVKFKEFSTQCGDRIVEEQYVQTSPVKELQLNAENTTPLKSNKNLNVKEHCTQTLPMYIDKTLHIDQSMIHTYLQMSKDVEENSNINSNGTEYIVKVSPVGKCKNIEEANTINKSTSCLIVKSLQNSCATESQKSGNILLQNQSDEIKLLVKKISGLRAHTFNVMETCVKAEFMEGLDASFCSDECSVNRAEQEIAALEGLLMRLKFYIKNINEYSELLNSQLESKFEEVISLELKLSDVELGLKKKEGDFATLSEKIFKLKQSLSQLTFMCRMITDIESESEFSKLKKSSDLSSTSQYSIPLHDVGLIQNMVLKLNSYMEENASKILNLSEKLKIVENELVILQKDKANIKFYSQFSRCTQTESTRGTFDLSEITRDCKSQKEKLLSQFENEIKSLKEKNDELEKNNFYLKEMQIDTEKCHSAQISALKANLETTHSDWKIKTMTLVKDLESKYEQELADQENKLTEELGAKILELNELKKEHLKEIVKKESEYKKNMSDLKQYFQSQIKDLEDQLFAENSEKCSLKTQLEQEKEREIFALRTKHEEIVNMYTNKIRRCKDIYCQSEMKNKHYADEIGRLKKENESLKEHECGKNDSLTRHLKEINSDLMNERDKIQKKLMDAKQYINQLNEKLKCKELSDEEELLQKRNANNSKDNEIENLKRENEKLKECEWNKSDSVTQRLKSINSELIRERDKLEKKYAAAKLYINELKEDLKVKRKELCDQEELLQKRNIDNSKNNEDSNKNLLYDLDQKKAKIMSLETNNTSLIQEVKKLREMLSSKASLSCKCKVNSRNSKTDIPSKNANCQDKGGKEKLDHRIDPEKVHENYAARKGGDENDENCKLNEKNVDQDKILCIGGGSGPANMVTSYYLETVIHKKDKEINKLRKELGDLQNEVKASKICPVMSSEKIKREVPQREIAVKAQVSPLQEMDENVTVFNAALHPYQPGAVPKIQSKQLMKERNRRTSGKPYDLNIKTETLKRQDIESEGHFMSKPKENKRGLKTKEEGLTYMMEGGSPECKQQ